MAIEHRCTCVWQLNIIHRLDRFWAGVARGEERSVVQGDLDTDKAHVRLAAVGECTIDHGKEDRCVRDRSCVKNLASSGVVEG